MAANLPPTVLRLIFQDIAVWQDGPTTNLSQKRSAAEDSHRELSNCSLVCRSWRGWAQAALYLGIVLYRQSSLLSLIWTLESRPDLANSVQDLYITPFIRMYDDPPPRASDLERLLSLTPNIGSYTLMLPDYRLEATAQRQCLPTYANARLSSLTVTGFPDSVLHNEALQDLPPGVQRLRLQCIQLASMTRIVQSYLEVLCLSNLEVSHLNYISFSGCPNLRRLILHSPTGLSSTALPCTLSDQLEVFEFIVSKPLRPNIYMSLISDVEACLAKTCENGTALARVKVVVNGGIEIEFDQDGRRMQIKGVNLCL